MYAAYSLLLTLGLVVLIPRFVYHAIAHHKYLSGFRERLGSVPPLDQRNPIIWLHCVSVGETQAARPLVTRLRREFPNHLLVVSTITLTGQKLARDVFKSNADKVFYFPFDWRWTVRRAINSVNPSAVLVMETELWPNFIRECRVRQIPVALVNGRISRQSFRRYRFIRFFMSRVLSGVQIAVMQSEEDARRILDLGMLESRVVNAGNLKFDSNPLNASTALTRQIQDRFAIRHDELLIVAASTHRQEEQIILESFRALEYRKTHRVRLMIAPRHPERFPEVAALLQSSGLTWARRTNQPQPSDTNVDVILLDTIGELPATYCLATIVFVGGSIADKGGHNTLEPAAVGAAIVTGPYTHNFDAIVSLMNEARAIVQLPRLDEGAVTETLRNVFDELLTDDDRRAQLGRRAKQLVANNQGAADRTLNLIAPLLSKKISPCRPTH